MSFLSTSAAIAAISREHLNGGAATRVRRLPLRVLPPHPSCAEAAHRVSSRDHAAYLAETRASWTSEIFVHVPERHMSAAESFAAPTKSPRNLAFAPLARTLPCIEVTTRACRARRSVIRELTVSKSDLIEVINEAVCISNGVVHHFRVQWAASEPRWTQNRGALPCGRGSPART